MRRKSVNKYSSAQKFRNNAERTKKLNLPRTVMRGGFRL